MTLKKYIQDQIVLFISWFVFCIILYVLLRLFKINQSAIIYIISIGIICALSYIIYDYWRKNQFYQQLDQYFSSMDQKNLITEMLQEPNFLEGKLCYQYLESSEKATNDMIGYYKNELCSYREYIEMWIHEVKTPVTAVDLIIENESMKEKNAIKDELEKINYYIDQALYYARSAGVEKDYMVKECDLQELVENSIKSNARMLITSKMKIVLGELDKKVFTDEKWINFILKQIIVNAVKYRKNSNSEIQFDSKEYSERIILQISDNGIGISEKDLPRVKEKGYTGTTGRTYVKSTGMGLYLCEKLSEKLGITFDIQSEEGIGTSIFISFPRNSMTFLKEE